MDSPDRSILYNFICENKGVKECIDDAQNIVGIPIIDIIDKFGDIPLYYCIKCQNYEAFRIILSYNPNLSYEDKDGNTIIHKLILHGKGVSSDIFRDLIKNISLDKQNNMGNTALHYAVMFNYNDAVKLFISFQCDLNLRNDEEEISPLFYAIKNDNEDIAHMLLEAGADTNVQDYLGNTILHYAINNSKLINLILRYKPNLDLTNLEGKTCLAYTSDIDIAKILIPNMDINSQDKDGKSILAHLFITGQWLHMTDILVKKQLLLYLKDNNNIQPLDYVISNDKLFTKLIRLIENSKTGCKDVRKCLLERKSVYLQEEHKEVVLMIDKTNVEFTTFIGIPLDILCGLFYLRTTHNCGITLNKSYKSLDSVNKMYDTLGYSYDYNYNFTGLGIHWIYQKIFFSDGLKDIIQSAQQDIVIPLAIELSAGRHSNYLFYDYKKKELERFEPSGSYYPYMYNYNPKLLDKLLQEYFACKYYSPLDYLPKIGFQKLEIYDSVRYKKIGDPCGFCALWCIWYADMRMSYKQYNRKELIDKLLIYHRQNGISLRNTIRDYSVKITRERDIILKKAGTDINKWNNEILNEQELKIIDRELLKRI